MLSKRYPIADLPILFRFGQYGMDAVVPPFEVAADKIEARFVIITINATHTLDVFARYQGFVLTASVNHLVYYVISVGGNDGPNIRYCHVVLQCLGTVA